MMIWAVLPPEDSDGQAEARARGISWVVTLRCCLAPGHFAASGGGYIVQNCYCYVCSMHCLSMMIFCMSVLYAMHARCRNETDDDEQSVWAMGQCPCGLRKESGEVMSAPGTSKATRFSARTRLPQGVPPGASCPRLSPPLHPPPTSPRRPPFPSPSLLLLPLAEHHASAKGELELVLAHDMASHKDHEHARPLPGRRFPQPPPRRETRHRRRPPHRA